MNVHTIAVSPPFQPQMPQQHTPESTAAEAFVSRAADVNNLIDQKSGFVMESARLRALAESSPELRERSLALIQTFEERIAGLQEQIDRELKGLLFSLQKAPAPSPFMDHLPG